MGFFGSVADFVSGGIGGMASSVLGSKNNTHVDTPILDAKAYQYGGDPNGAADAANRYRGWADSAQSRLGAQADFSGAQPDMGDANRWEDQSIGNAASQGNVANMMVNRATGATPSIAGMQARQDQAQLAQQAQQQGQAAVAAQAAQAGSARGAAGLALAQQNAANNVANTQGQIGTSTALASQNISGQAQVNAANERMQAENSAFGALSGMRGQAAAQQAQGANQALAAAGLNTQQQSFNANLAQGQRALNDQMSLGMTQNEIGVNNSQLAASQNQQSQQSANTFGAANINAGVAGQNAAMNQKNGMAVVNMVASGASGGAGGAAGGAGGAMPAAATGGPVAGGRPVLTGEQGPELVVPSSPADAVLSTWGTGQPITTDQARAWGDANLAAAKATEARDRANPSGPMAYTSPIESQRLRDQDTVARSRAYEAEGYRPTEDPEALAKDARAFDAAQYRLAQDRKFAQKYPAERAAGGSAEEPGTKAPAGAKPSSTNRALGSIAAESRRQADSTDVGYRPGGGYVPPMLLQAREGGGPVAAGSSYLTGERGPEMVMPLYEPEGKQLHQSFDGHGYLADEPKAGPNLPSLAGAGGGDSKAKAPPQSAPRAAAKPAARQMTPEEMMKAADAIQSQQAAYYGSQMARGAAVGAREGGGPVDGGQPYLVGEKGPEVIVPPRDATVIPAGPTARLLKDAKPREMQTFQRNNQDGPALQFKAERPEEGMVERGNIDLHSRPVVKNADGSISTVRSMGVNMDGREVLLPTVSPDGRVLSDKEAVDLYRQTGQHLGKFDTPANSDAYAQKLHEDQAREYSAHEFGPAPDGPSPLPPPRPPPITVSRQQREDLRAKDADEAARAAAQEQALWERWQATRPESTTWANRMQRVMLRQPQLAEERDPGPAKPSPSEIVLQLAAGRKSTGSTHATPARRR